MIKILKLQDRTDPKEINYEVIVETELNECKIQEEVDKIINDFEKKGFDCWTYEDVLNSLEKKELIKILESDTLTIWA